jgi:hypothetical protein
MTFNGAITMELASEYVETQLCRSIAFALNDGALRTELVSANQVRQIIRAGLVELTKLEDENVHLRKIIAYSDGALERSRKDAFRMGEEVGLKTMDDAAGALLESPLTPERAIAAVLMTLTSNGVAAHNGDGTCIIAAALSQRSGACQQTVARPALIPEELKP